MLYCTGRTRGPGEYMGAEGGEGLCPVDPTTPVQ